MKSLLQRKNVFEKSEMTINWIKTLIGEVSEEEIIRIFGHLAKSYYNRYQNELTEKEMIVYDAVLKEELKPETIYEWLLAANIDDKHKRKLLKGEISQKQATRFGSVEVMRLKARKSLAFLTRARGLLHNLKWRATE